MPSAVTQPAAVKLLLWHHWIPVTQMQPVTAENQFHCTRLYFFFFWTSRNHHQKCKTWKNPENVSVCSILSGLTSPGLDFSVRRSGTYAFLFPVLFSLLFIDREGSNAHCLTCSDKSSSQKFAKALWNIQHSFFMGGGGGRRLYNLKKKLKKWTFQSKKKQKRTVSRHTF